MLLYMVKLLRGETFTFRVKMVLAESFAIALVDILPINKATIHGQRFKIE